MRHGVYKNLIFMEVVVARKQQLDFDLDRDALWVGIGKQGNKIANQGYPAQVRTQDSRIVSRWMEIHQLHIRTDFIELYNSGTSCAKLYLALVLMAVCQHRRVHRGLFRIPIWNDPQATIILSR